MAGTTAAGPSPEDAAGLDATARLASRGYLALLLLAALIGIPISASAYYFLHLVVLIQQWVFVDLPRTAGFGGTPVWWPVPVLLLSGLLTGAIVKYAPGAGGHSPVDGFSAKAVPRPVELPGVLGAALASLGLGVVLGPEAPLITLGGGLAVLSLRLARRQAPRRLGAVVAAAGSFASISALLGSPLIGAFLLMEVSGLAGPELGLVLVPGLLSAGIGSLVFVGLDEVTGLGRVSLALPGLPPFDRPTLAEFGWALLIGALAAVAGSAVRRLAVALRPLSERWTVPATAVAGLVIAALAIVYPTGTGHTASDVLFSGEQGLDTLLAANSTYSVPALLTLMGCKGVAYGVSLSSFRGGPVFPAMFLGAAGGIAMSHLPGLPLVAGVATGIGAMSVVMLRLPLTSVMLATLLLFSSGVAVMPLVIVAVVVAYVVSARLEPRPANAR
ncbi:chloride channel protein [Amycolatopsis pigmentata]|uniref:Chloride channel protein n=1 Tax=Amycolatopsis pigmentata TaxID=450801 RepID=A0ABW5G042_9PSEU